MGALDAVAGRVAGGAIVTFRPSGSSMVPLIRSRQQVVVAPVDPSKLVVGDIVLARVAGTVYLHLVPSVDPARKRVQISNNRGRVNGWTSHDRVFGILCGSRRRHPVRSRRQDCRGRPQRLLLNLTLQGHRAVKLCGWQNECAFARSMTTRAGGYCG